MDIRKYDFYVLTVDGYHYDMDFVMDESLAKNIAALVREIGDGVDVGLYEKIDF